LAAALQSIQLVYIVLVRTNVALCWYASVEYSEIIRCTY